MITCLALFLLPSCHNYYKATPGRIGAHASGTVDSLQQLNRHFILRNGKQALYMRNLVLSSDHKLLTARLDSVPPNHLLYIGGGHRRNMRFKPSRSDEVGVLSEVHLYTIGLPRLVAGENVSVPLDQVETIEIIEKDKKRTTNSYVIGALGYTVAALTAAAVIALATKSSCPFVSAYSGKDFVLQGEIYGGAIYPQLARHDYLPLKMAPLSDGSLQVKISNELKEKQFTDLAELWVVTHGKETTIYNDENGELYSVSAPQAPLTATLNGQKDLLPALQKQNDNAVAYLDDTTTADATNSVLLRFKKDAAAQRGKLVLTLKNGYFLDLLYGELAKGFGNYYETYLAQQSKKPAAQLQQWITDQQLPLSVLVRGKAGWKMVKVITTTGPLAYRTLVVPIDVNDSETDVEVKLTSGFQFWELDYAAMDFSNNSDFTVEKLRPVKAVDERGNDVLPALQEEDSRSLEQPQIGNSATLTYRPSTQLDPQTQQTCILHAKGWYQHIRNYQHGPNAAFLKQFLQPGAFPAYGKELYRQLQTENLRLFAAK